MDDRRWQQQQNALSALRERLAGVESQLETLEREVQRLRAWRHDVANKITVPIQDELNKLGLTFQRALEAVQVGKPAPRVAKTSALTVKDFWLVVGTITSTVAVLKFFGLLKLIVGP